MKAYLLIPLLALSLPAFAQSQAPQSASPPDGSSSTQQQPGQGGRKRFIDADTDHDGKLSRKEAEALPFVSRHFDEFDADHDGYITREEFRAAREHMQALREQRAARKQAGSSTPPPPDSGNQGSN